VTTDEQVAALEEALAFAASVIKSGEQWSPTAQQVIGGALANAQASAKAYTARVRYKALEDAEEVAQAVVHRALEDAKLRFQSLARELLGTLVEVGIPLEVLVDIDAHKPIEQISPSLRASLLDARDRVRAVLADANEALKP